jgi:hypothetical protein
VESVPSTPGLGPGNATSSSQTKKSRKKIQEEEKAKEFSFSICKADGTILFWVRSKNYSPIMSWNVWTLASSRKRSGRSKTRKRSRMTDL